MENPGGIKSEDADETRRAEPNFDGSPWTPVVLVRALALAQETVASLAVAANIASPDATPTFWPPITSAES